MGYKKEKKLPTELIEKIQEYVDGETVYIPKKTNRRRKWGASHGNDLALAERNAEIYAKYKNGKSVRKLSDEYYISTQGIYKILSKFK